MLDAPNASQSAIPHQCQNQTTTLLKQFKARLHTMRPVGPMGAIQCISQVHLWQAGGDAAIAREKRTLLGVDGIVQTVVMANAFIATSWDSLVYKPSKNLRFQQLACMMWALEHRLPRDTGTGSYWFRIYPCLKA